MTGIELKVLDGINTKSQAAEIQAGEKGISSEVSDSIVKIKEDVSGSSVDRWIPEKLMAGFVAVEALVEAVALLNGVGDPAQGGEFRAGGQKLSGDITAILDGANPSQWSGEAAEEYISQQLSQQAAVSAVADADRRIARLLVEQSSWVQKTRDDLAEARRTAISGLVLGGTYYALCQVYRGLPFEHVVVLQMFFALIVIALIVALEILMTLVALGEYATYSRRELLAVANDYQSASDTVAAVTATAKLARAAMPLPDQSAAFAELHSGLLRSSDLTGAMSGSLREMAPANVSTGAVIAAPRAVSHPGRVSGYGNRDVRSSVSAGSPIARAHHVPAARVTSDEPDDDGSALAEGVPQQALVGAALAGPQHARPAAHFV